jgi:hypothetical protein
MLFAWGSSIRTALAEATAAVLLVLVTCIQQPICGCWICCGGIVSLVLVASKAAVRGK